MKKPVRAYEEAIDMAVARYAADPTFLSVSYTHLGIVEKILTYSYSNV